MPDIIQQKDIKAMREIEFKGIRKDNGKWAYGDLIHGVNHKAGNIYILPTLGGVLPMLECDPLDGYEVIPETVCQWTGLLDKQGSKIFEGDIFQYRKHDGYLLPDFTSEVLFMMGCFGYVVTSKNMVEVFISFSEIDELQEDFLNHIEIIGNIHDKEQQKQALINMMRMDEELGLYDITDNDNK